MITRLLSGLLGWKGVLIGIGVAIAVGFAGGWKVRDAFCDAASAAVTVRIQQQRIAALEDNLARIRRVQEQDNAQTAAQLEALRKLEEQHRALVDQISNGECLTRDDLDRLRAGWGS